MVLLTRPFREFMDNFYIPTLEKYAYHRHHYILLSKNICGLDRKKSLKPGDIETTRDYAERLSFELNNEIMSQHFGNSISLSMEGVAVRFFNKEKVNEFSNNNQASYDFEKDTLMNFHSHLSDFSFQNASSTHQHMNVLLDYLRNQKVMKEGSTVYCNSDGSSKQY